jgi:hypothetical protein
MPSVLIALVASLPLLLLPPGVCPCHVFGLECDDFATPHHNGPDDQDHDCGCPKVKVLAAPAVPVSHSGDTGLVLGVVPDALFAENNVEVVFQPVLLPHALADPSLYLMLRALRC